MSILSQVKPASEVGNSSLNLLVYGPPGTGKTHLAGTLPNKRVLLLDADKGTMTIRHGSVDVLQVSEPNILRAALGELKKGGHGYDVVILDHLTEVQQQLVREAKGPQGRMNQASWGKVIDATAEICRYMRDIPVSCVVLCHSTEVEDDGGVRVRPSLSGKKLPHQIPGLFDLVGYSYCRKDDEGEIRYGLAFVSGSEKYVCKDRSNTLNPTEPNDLSVIFGKVLGSTPAEEAV